MAAATPNTGTSSANVANQTTDSNSNSTASTTTTDTTTYSTTTTTSTPTTTAMTKATSSPDPTTNSICKTSDSSKNNDSTDASSSTTSTNASNLNSGSNNQIKQQPKSQQQTVSDCRNSSSSSSSPPSPVTTKASSSSSDSTTIAASKTESEEGKTCGSKDVNSKNADVKPQQNSSNNENKTDNDDTIKLTKSSNEQSNDALKNNSNSNNNANECSNGSNSNNISNNNVVTSKSNALQAIPSVASTTAPTSSISSSGISNASSGSTHDHASGGDGNNFSQESNGPVGNRDIVSRNNNNARMDDDPQQHHHQQQQLQQHHHHQQQNSYQHHNKTSNQQQQQQHHHHHHHHNNQQQSHAHPNQHHHTHHHNEQLSKTNLYIKGLHADTSDHDLFSLCNRYGSIVSTKAILDKNTNKCKGYGFVDFETPASAEVAVVELQKQGILVHMAKQQEADPTNLYIVNLPQMMTESELEDLLKTYCPAGQVVSTRILINQNRQPRGVGFARMETKEQCDAIIASLNGQIIKGSKEPLLVKFADGASKKRVHHFQHKPLGANAFMGDHLWRNNSNDTNYHMMNSGPGNRNFHGGSFDHSRQNHSMSHHNNGLVKHQMMSSLSGYHPHHQGGHHTHTSAHHNHQQHHQSQLQHHHHGHNHSSHSSHRNQNQGLYTGGTAFPMSASMSGANDASQWLHPPQAGQP